MPDKGGVNWVEFVRGYNKCCARVSASVSLNMLCRVFIAIAGRANVPLHLEFESEDDDCKINGHLLPSDVVLLLNMCWFMSWDCRNLGNFEGKGDLRLPDLSHLVLSAITSCAKVEGGFNVWDCDISSLEVELPWGKFVTWVMSTVPCLPDCLRQYFHSRLQLAGVICVFIFNGVIDHHEFMKFKRNPKFQEILRCSQIEKKVLLCFVQYLIFKPFH